MHKKSDERRKQAANLNSNKPASQNYVIRHDKTEAENKRKAAADEKKKKANEERQRLPKRLTIVRCDNGVVCAQKDGASVIQAVKEKHVSTEPRDWKLLRESPFDLCYAVTTETFNFAQSLRVKGTWLILDTTCLEGNNNEEEQQVASQGAAEGVGIDHAGNAAAPSSAAQPVA
jgi:uncharacterized protein (DUF4415 family)